MTLLELVRTMCQRLGFSDPNGVIGSNDKTIRQISALLTQLGSDLVTQHPWRRLYREHLLTTRAVDMVVNMTVGSRVLSMQDASLFSSKWMAVGEGMPSLNKVSEQISSTSVRMAEPATKTGYFNITFHQFAYPLPSDWHRQVPQTEWGRTNHSPISGPKTPQAWQQYKSGVVYHGLMEIFRLVGNDLHLLPPAPNGLTFSFEYISKNWVVSGSSSGARDAPASDDDRFIFSDSLLMTGLVARWFDVHGMDSTIEKADFAALLSMAKAQDQSAAALTISPGSVSGLISSRQIPDGNWSI